MSGVTAPESVCGAVTKWAMANPHKLALVSATCGSLSYGELDERVAVAAGALSRRWGVGEGDAVVLSSGRGIAFVVAYLAVHRLGAVAIPLPSEAPEKRVARVAELMAARVVLSREASEQLSAEDCEESPIIVRRLSRPDLLADVMFTSGTTGEQKAVMLTHGNLMGAVANINQFIGTCESDVEVIALPLSHSFGLGRLRCCLVAGATVVVANGFARVKQLFSVLDDSGATGFSMVPAAWRVLQRTSGDRLGRLDGQLRYVELGSAWMSADEKRVLARLLPNTRVIMHYGLTEASRATFLEFGRNGERLDSVGRAGPLVDIGVFSADGERLGCGVDGEICVRGPMVTSGYFGDLDRTSGAYFGEWFRTGDIGSIDEDGFLVLRGRLDELINVGGRKVVPEEIEESLLALDAVADVACVGVPDPLAGQRVKAFVCWSGQPMGLTELVDLVRSELEHFKLPTEVKTVAVIPRTSSGKIQRRKLLEEDNG